MTMMDKEKALTKRARGLTNEVLKERIALQEAKFQESEETVRTAPHSIPHTHVATYSQRVDHAHERKSEPCISI